MADTSAVKGIADGINQGIQNYYSLKGMKQSLDQKNQEFETDHKIKKLQLSKLENDMSPEKMASANELLKIQQDIQKKQYKAYNISLGNALSDTEKKVTEQQTYVKGGVAAMGAMQQMGAMQNLNAVQGAFSGGKVDFDALQGAQTKRTLDNYLGQKDLTKLTAGEITQAKRIAGTDAAAQKYLKNILPTKTTTATNPYGLEAKDLVLAKSMIHAEWGTRAMNKQENVDLVAQMMSEGQSRDDIEDFLAESSQSEDMPLTARRAIERLVGMTGRKGLKDEIIGTYDNILDEQGAGEANDYVLEMARQRDTKQGPKIAAKERTVELFSSVQDSLKEYEKLGGKTGILKGTYESVLNRLGRTSDPRLVEIANTISMQLIAYKRDNTGTAYSVQEGREYNKIFPNINSVNLSNMAKIDSLTNVFNGDVDHFYKRKLGSFYEKEVKGIGGQAPEKKQGEFDSFSDEDLMKIAQGGV